MKLFSSKIKLIKQFIKQLYVKFYLVVLKLQIKTMLFFTNKKVNKEDNVLKLGSIMFYDIKRGVNKPGIYVDENKKIFIIYDYDKGKLKPMAYFDTKLIKNIANLSMFVSEYIQLRTHQIYIPEEQKH